MAYAKSQRTHLGIIRTPKDWNVRFLSCQVMKEFDTVHRRFVLIRWVF